MVLVGLILVLIVVRWLPMLIPAAVIVYGCRRWHWHRRPSAAISPAAPVPPPRTVIQSRPVIDPEAERLRAENDQLRAALADAEQARDAAWDAAASVPPRPGRDESTARDRLLSDPLGSVHDLFGRQP